MSKVVFKGLPNSVTNSPVEAVLSEFPEGLVAQALSLFLLPGIGALSRYTPQTDPYRIDILLACNFLSEKKKKQKNPRVRKIFCPQFWGRKLLRQFYGRQKKCALSAGKTMSIQFRVLGEGGEFGVLGWGECRFYFNGREDFFSKKSQIRGGGYRTSRCPLKGIAL